MIKFAFAALLALTLASTLTGCQWEDKREGHVSSPVGAAR